MGFFLFASLQEQGRLELQEEESARVEAGGHED
jgi:hypothetical protein